MLAGLPADAPRQRRPDIRKAQDLLEWQPRVPLEAGQTRTIAYFITMIERGEGLRSAAE